MSFVILLVITITRDRRGDVVDLMPNLGLGEPFLGGGGIKNKIMFSTEPSFFFLPRNQ